LSTTSFHIYLFNSLYDLTFCFLGLRVYPDRKKWFRWWWN